MGKKLKTGKSRRDKYYKLAKETGYRSRAAFKLIQLNRKFGFLQTSRVVLDLCAAPGGWLQVAAQNTPLSSVIIGVDIVPIASISRVSTFQADITTEKCSMELKRQLHKWNADCILHDGAPNVGLNWIQDAYRQAELTLAALRLVTQFLRKGGWFITKMFRSKDYNSLRWVFQQLFQHVHSTKPQASRSESAEIYVVCQGYVAPEKIDPKFLDIRHVFKELDQDSTELPKLNLRKPEQKIRHSQGYPEGEVLFTKTLSATEFFNATNHLERLSMATEITFGPEDDKILNHWLTTSEIKEMCKDIRVLGKKDLTNLIKWRKKYLKILEEDERSNKQPLPDDVDSEAEEKQMDKCIKEIQDNERATEKRKVKKVRREKRKLTEKMAKFLSSQLDCGIEDTQLFSVKRIKTGEQLKEVEESDLAVLDADDEKDYSVDIRQRPPAPLVDKDLKEHLEDTDDDISNESSDEEISFGSGEESEDEKDERHLEIDKDDEGTNPLVVELDDKDTRSSNLAYTWFNKESFCGLDEEHDDDVEMRKMFEEFKRKGGKLIDEKVKEKERLNFNKNDDVSIRRKNKNKNNSSDIIEPRTSPTENAYDEDSENGSDCDDTANVSDCDDTANVSDCDDTANVSDCDDTANVSDCGDTANVSDSGDTVNVSDCDDTEYGSSIMLNNSKSPRDNFDEESGRSKHNKLKQKSNQIIQENGFEIVPSEEIEFRESLDEVGLALGAAIASLRKRRREIIEDGFNRYNYDDDNLPSWFTKDEKNHRIRPLPITKEEVREYQERQKEIDAQPIKKIAEAKARKKRRQQVRLKKARKKAEALNDTQDVSEKEKWSQIKQIYKKAGLLNNKKKEVTYVVAKKGTAGQRVRRPAGVKGHFRVVDPREKKDKRREKMKAKLKKGKKHRHARK